MTGNTVRVGIAPARICLRVRLGCYCLYATFWCGYCAKTRELLNKNGIKYFEYDVGKSTEGREQRKKLGGNGVPVLVINWDVVKGYKPNKILNLVSKK